MTGKSRTLLAPLFLLAVLLGVLFAVFPGILMLRIGLG